MSFYELRSLIFDLTTPILEKLRKTVRELGIEEEVEGDLGPQELYDALCGWKEKHNRADQAKILRDALERADFEEAWLIILGLSNVPLAYESLCSIQMIFVCFVLFVCYLGDVALQTFNLNHVCCTPDLRGF